RCRRHARLGQASGLLFRSLGVLQQEPQSAARGEVRPALAVQSNLLKSGLRFSKKAVNASLASAPVSIALKRSFSTAMVSFTSAPRARFISALVVRIDAGGSLASLAAWP